VKYKRVRVLGTVPVVSSERWRNAVDLRETTVDDPPLRGSRPLPAVYAYTHSIHMNDVNIVTWITRYTCTCLNVSKIVGGGIAYVMGGIWKDLKVKKSWG